jgi:hypothetical protein
MQIKPRLKLVQIRLNEEDLKTLKLTYPTSGYNAIVRALVARHARELRNRVQELMTQDELIEAQE